MVSDMGSVADPKICTATVSFYRAMHYCAKRGIAIACRLSVRLWRPVKLVEYDQTGWKSWKLSTRTIRLVSKISNLCDPDPPNVTDRDRRTDGRTTCNLNTALVHRAVKSISCLRATSILADTISRQILSLSLDVQKLKGFWLPDQVLSARGPRWRHNPQTPVINSHSRAHHGPTLPNYFRRHRASSGGPGGRDRPGPAGQQSSSGRALVTRDQSRSPRSDATDIAGSALRTTMTKLGRL